MGTIYREIRQSKPFEHLEREVLVTLLRTADAVRRKTERALKPWRLTPEEYNVLRILRGAPQPLAEIAARMVSGRPNLARIVRRRLVKRDRTGTFRITDDGLRVIQEAAPTIEKLTLSCLEGASKDSMNAAVALLDRIRANV
jgi:DNA-binding MarR family transcriptional regulator